MKLWILPLGMLAACTGGIQTISTPGGDVSEQPDETPPEIVHEPVEGAQAWGQDVDIRALVTDEESGVFQVTVYYKQETSTVWDDNTLTRVDQDGTFEGVIRGDAVGSGGMHYYIEAVDYDENTSTMPDGGADDPYHFRVTAD